MDKKDKLELSESDIDAKFITPAILDAAWDEMTQIRREVTFTTRNRMVIKSSERQ
ncbi:hypothetical protein [Persicirhabdus sediminis]|uniref:Uncharacterized protein n=1 Tax=Persicirhabdus sediminis TaxID=454144 RepID=A0A8J7MBC6_9BACT|nr:hypothetical protein [Persicirhabdus sediminis]MBK1789861.1 hypothetical protein [Persicirhabdus sediminis]